MIVVDDRVGSVDLAKYIEALGTAPEVARLASGDAAIQGWGPAGQGASVGVELKRLSDLLGTIRDGRFVASQLPILKDSYDIVYLVVEGKFRRGERGAIEVPRRGGWETPPWARFLGHWGLEQWLLSVELKGGIRVRFTDSPQGTALLLAMLDSWFAAGWESHRTVQALDRSYRVRDRADEWVEAAPPTKIGRATQLAKELPGLGEERARAAARHFRTGRRMAAASEADWLAVPGVGKTLARRIYAAWDEEEPQ